MADSSTIREPSSTGDSGLFGDISKPDQQPVNPAHRKPAANDNGAKRSHHRRNPPIVNPADSTSSESGTSSTSSRASSPSGKSRANTTTRTPAQKRETLEALMFSLHLSAAAMLKTPELAITEKESARLVLAWQHVLDVYGIPEVSEKTAAAMELAGAAGAVYLPRMLAIGLRKKKNRPAIVTPFPSPAPQQQTPPAPNGKPAAAPATSKADASGKYDALSMAPQESVLQ
jgi:hypothetical protein